MSFQKLEGPSAPSAGGPDSENIYSPSIQVTDQPIAVDEPPATPDTVHQQPLQAVGRVPKKSSLVGSLTLVHISTEKTRPGVPEEDDVQPTVHSEPCHDIHGVEATIIFPTPSTSYPIGRPACHSDDTLPNALTLDQQNEQGDICQNSVNEESVALDFDNQPEGDINLDEINLDTTSQDDGSPDSAITDNISRTGRLEDGQDDISQDGASRENGSQLSQLIGNQRRVPDNENLLKKICIPYRLILYMILTGICLAALVAGVCFAGLHYFTTKPKGTELCETYYMLSLDNVKCGEVDSRKYSEIMIKGAHQGGDKLSGLVKVWLIPEIDLKFFSILQHSSDGKYCPTHEYVRLNGWWYYTWKNSIIYGSCCIMNNGSTNKTAFLYVFLSDEDFQDFIEGKGARNAILSENITVPANGSQCFHKWGPGAPLKVVKSSYHYIAVDIPANTTFSSNITVNQSVVDTSGYGMPRYIDSGNSTCFNNLSSHHNDYIAICGAPLSKSMLQKVGSESLHVRSCNEPKALHSERLTKQAILGVCLLGFSGGTLILILLLCSYDLHKYRKHRKDLQAGQNRNYGSTQ